MEYIAELLPDADVLITMEPDELAPILLRIAKQCVRNGIFAPGNISKFPNQVNIGQAYPSHVKHDAAVDIAIAEGWNWLRVQGFLVPAPGMNGNNGFLSLSRRAQALQNDEDFQRFKEAASFPKSLLHPKFSDKVWLSLARGDLDEAVFTSFKAVEERVREVGKFQNTDIGVALMRKAFDKTTGPLTNMNQPEAERDALAHLFAGAIGSYKNPHSHRTVRLTDSKDAQEMILLASHLMRIVDAREI